MPGPLVSVIVPVYKVEPYLRHCLDSIVGQTYKNLEIILIDDGSPDSCPAICDEYATKDNRIVVVHGENGGASVARNAGLNRAHGEYIAFIDGDDWAEDDCVEHMVTLALANESEMVISDYSKTGDVTETRHVSLPEGRISGNRAVVSAFCACSYPFSPWAKLYKASFLGTTRFSDGLLFEDQLWSCQLAVAASNIYVAHAKSYHYVVHDDSLTTGDRSSNEERLASWRFILSNQYGLLRSYLPEMDDEIRRFVTSKIMEVCALLLPRKMPFLQIFLSLGKALGENPLHFWKSRFGGKTRLLFEFLGVFPQIVGGTVLRLMFLVSPKFRSRVLT